MNRGKSDKPNVRLEIVKSDSDVTKKQTPKALNTIARTCKATTNKFSIPEIILNGGALSETTLSGTELGAFCTKEQAKEATYETKSKAAERHKHTVDSSCKPNENQVSSKRTESTILSGYNNPFTHQRFNRLHNQWGSVVTTCDGNRNIKVDNLALTSLDSSKQKEINAAKPSIPTENEREKTEKQYENNAPEKKTGNLIAENQNLINRIAEAGAEAQSTIPAQTEESATENNMMTDKELKEQILQSSLKAAEKQLIVNYLTSFSGNEISLCSAYGNTKVVDDVQPEVSDTTAENDSAINTTDLTNYTQLIRNKEFCEKQSLETADSLKNVIGTNETEKKANGKKIAYKSQSEPQSESINIPPGNAKISKKQEVNSMPDVEFQFICDKLRKDGKESTLSPLGKRKTQLKNVKPYDTVQKETEEIMAEMKHSENAKDEKNEETSWSQISNFQQPMVISVKTQSKRKTTEAKPIQCLDFKSSFRSNQEEADKTNNEENYRKLISLNVDDPKKLSPLTPIRYSLSSVHEKSSNSERIQSYDKYQMSPKVLIETTERFIRGSRARSAERKRERNILRRTVNDVNTQLYSRVRCHYHSSSILGQINQSRLKPSTKVPSMINFATYLDESRMLFGLASHQL